MKQIVISDTSCLIILTKIDALSILKDCFDSIVVTSEIAREFGQPLPDWIKITSTKRLDLQLLLEESIDRGESSAIALAVELGNCNLILDDFRARKIAASLHLEFTGTLGVIAHAKKIRVIRSARAVFEKIQATDFRVSDELIAAILAQLGE